MSTTIAVMLGAAEQGWQQGWASADDRAPHAMPQDIEGVREEWCWGDDPELCLYRPQTLWLLKRYGRMSVEVGRLPSLLGREFFRTRVTSRQQCTFEDAVIFVHDVERSLERLDGFSQKVIARVVLQDYTREEAARLLGCCERQLRRTYCEALDHLSEIFLQGGLLKRE